MSASPIRQLDLRHGPAQRVAVDRDPAVARPCALDEREAVVLGDRAVRGRERLVRRRARRGRGSRRSRARPASSPCPAARSHARPPRASRRPVRPAGVSRRTPSSGSRRRRGCRRWPTCPMRVSSTLPSSCRLSRAVDPRGRSAVARRWLDGRDRSGRSGTRSPDRFAEGELVDDRDRAEQGPGDEHHHDREPGPDARGAGGVARRRRGDAGRSRGRRTSAVANRATSHG